MIRGLFFCVIACGVAAPAMAGERNTPSPALRAVTAPILPVALQFPGHDGALTIRGDFVVRFRGTPEPTVSLIDFENRVAQRFDILPAEAAPADLASLHATANLRSLEAWRLTDKLAPVTMRANGVYAVRDLLGEHRKPRVFRPSPLNMMLVLRIDGKEESAPFSVGGGGVAAALWRALPQ